MPLHNTPLAPPAQGIGVRLQRKEDKRFLHGRGNYVSDMILPGQSEVAFLRSPIAHGKLKNIVKPQRLGDVIFTREDMLDVKPIVARGAFPTYKISEHHPLAHEKVRFVGEPIAMAFASTRAEAECILECVEFDIDELPAIVDAVVARTDHTSRVREEWENNLYLTLGMDKGFDEHSGKADVIVKRELALRANVWSRLRERV